MLHASLMVTGGFRLAQGELPNITICEWLPFKNGCTAFYPTGGVILPRFTDHG